ncbi:MAG: cytidylate kinase family protein [Clostridia bacterium]|nr:cytidylate kinase family protein [Clostridia bacterium]
MTVISISSQIGSLGSNIAGRLASKRNCVVINRDYVMAYIFNGINEGQRNRLDESAKFYLSNFKDNKTYKEILLNGIKDICDDCNKSSTDIIILGLGGNFLLNQLNIDHVSIRVIDSETNRKRRICKRYNIDEAASSETLTVGDRRSKRFVNILFEKDINDIESYDLVINSGKVTEDEGLSLIEALIEARMLRKGIEAQTALNDSMNHQKEAVVFKNSTEEEFASILDAYGIEWVYEPKTFPIEWDVTGNIKSAFAPDFYLPKFDMYLELTTMDQKYVTKKNKKLRKVKELYPGTNIRIVYKRDFEELVERLRGFNG